MFKKFFGRKEEKPVSQPTPEVSKGYHTCVDSCERDILNLEAEVELLKKDNATLMGKFSTLQVSEKELSTQRDALLDDLRDKDRALEERDERISELEKRLEEADEKADGTPVKYASARKALTKAKLKQLRERLEAVPAGAQGFGGSCSVYDKKTKRLTVVEFKSKEEALELVAKAEKGNVDIVM